MEKQLTGLQFKKKYGTEFYKILKEDLCHNNFQYVEGENIDTIKFNPSGFCLPGGLYFTNLENIYNFLDFGEKVCKVIIDDDSLVYVDENNDKITKFKANKITIKNIQIMNYDSYLFDEENKYKLAIKQNGLSIQYIKDENQTEEICKIAVSQSGFALQYIKDEKQTEEICKLAVLQNGFAIKYITFMKNKQKKYVN